MWIVPRATPVDVPALAMPRAWPISCVVPGKVMSKNSFLSSFSRVAFSSSSRFALKFSSSSILILFRVWPASFRSFSGRSLMPRRC